MKVKPFFVVFPVLVGVIIYAYYAPEEKPEGAADLSPKEYIELVEKKRSEKQQAMKTEEEAPAPEPKKEEKSGGDTSK